MREVELTDDLLRVASHPRSLDDLVLIEPVVEALLGAPAAEVAGLREVLPRIPVYGALITGRD